MIVLTAGELLNRFLANVGNISLFLHTSLYNETLNPNPKRPVVQNTIMLSLVFLRFVVVVITTPTAEAQLHSENPETPLSAQISLNSLLKLPF